VTEYSLEAIGVTKRFPGVLALDSAELRVKAGTVHALIGQNGAGKSTLIKILFGVYQRDKGSLRVEGKEIGSMDPRLAHELGMAIIPQERTLVPEMTVAENLFLGREAAGAGSILIDKRRLKAEAQTWIERLDLDISVAAKVNSLGAGSQQLVELVRALACNARIVIMDEPTSGLTEQEVQRLFTVVHNLQKQGVSIIYISHRMEEIFEISQAITVLRDGRTVATMNTADTSTSELISLITGKAVEKQQEVVSDSTVSERVALKVENLSWGHRLSGVSFEIREGEILGLAGILGSGRSELMRCIFGSTPMDSGEIYLNGVRRSIHSPADAIAHGIGLLPENRRRDGLCLNMTGRDNITLPSPEAIFELGVLMRGRQKSLTAQVADDVSMSRDYLPRECRNLSGGNQQKALLARWLSRQCHVVLLDEPTNGVDVGAKPDIHNLIRSLAGQGKAVLVASSEFPELLSLCHRILVLRNGQIKHDIPNHNLSEHELLGYAAGEDMGGVA